MTTENWREEFRKLWGVDRGGDYWNDPECSALQMHDFISTLLSKERNEAYEKGFTTGRQGVELECKEAMKLNYWDKEKRNEVIDEVKKEVEELNKLSLCGKCEISTKNELSHTQLCNYKKKISTLLENLKVK